MHFPYKCQSTGKIYNSIILSLERVNDKYSLPGGQFDPRTNSDTLDTTELKGIGFFNAGRDNQIPDARLDKHIRALTSKYFGTAYERKTPSEIVIPECYFKGNKDQRILDWLTQRASF